LVAETSESGDVLISRCLSLIFVDVAVNRCYSFLDWIVKLW